MKYPTNGLKRRWRIRDSLLSEAMKTPRSNVEIPRSCLGGYAESDYCNRNVTRKKKQKKKLNFVPLEVFLAITGTMILAHVVPSRRGFLAG